MAKEPCILYVLSKKNLLQMYGRFQEALGPFMSIIYLRKKMIKQLYNRAWKYCEDNTYPGQEGVLDSTNFFREN